MIDSKFHDLESLLEEMRDTQHQIRELEEEWQTVHDNLQRLNQKQHTLQDSARQLQRILNHCLIHDVDPVHARLSLDTQQQEVPEPSYGYPYTGSAISNEVPKKQPGSSLATLKRIMSRIKKNNN